MLVHLSLPALDVELSHVKAESLATLFPTGFLAHNYDLILDDGIALDLPDGNVDACLSTDSAAKAAYMHAIELLVLNLRNTVLDPENRMVVLSWLANVPDVYLSLLHTRMPIA